MNVLAGIGLFVGGLVVVALMILLLAGIQKMWEGEVNRCLDKLRWRMPLSYIVRDSKGERYYAKNLMRQSLLYKYLPKEDADDSP